MSLDEVAPIVSTEGPGSCARHVRRRARGARRRTPATAAVPGAPSGLRQRRRAASSIDAARRARRTHHVDDDGRRHGRGDDRRRGRRVRGRRRRRRRHGRGRHPSRSASRGLAVLAQPAPAGLAARRRHRRRRRSCGSTPMRSAATGAVVESRRSAPAEPLAPIVHEGCVFTVGTEPPTFTRICNGVADQTVPLTGADPGPRCGCASSTAGCGSTT